MRKLLFAYLLIFFSVILSNAVFAQSPISRGSMIISGLFGFNNYRDSRETKGNSITFYPSINYFVISGLTIGGRAYLSYYSYSYADNTSSNYRYLGIGPTISYYFGKPRFGTDIVGTIYPFIELSALYRAEKYSSNTGEAKGGYKEFVIDGGICYMLSRVFGLKIEIGYRYTTDSMFYDKTNNIYVNVGFVSFYY